MVLVVVALGREQEEMSETVSKLMLKESARERRSKKLKAKLVQVRRWAIVCS